MVTCSACQRCARDSCWRDRRWRIEAFLSFGAQPLQQEDDETQSGAKPGLLMARFINAGPAVTRARRAGSCRWELLCSNTCPCTSSTTRRWCWRSFIHAYWLYKMLRTAVSRRTRRKTGTSAGTGPLRPAGDVCVWIHAVSWARYWQYRSW